MSSDEPRKPEDLGNQPPAAEEARLRRRPVRRQQETERHPEAARETESQRTRPWEEPEYTRPSHASDAA